MDGAFGELLRRFRRDAGLTQAGLAELSGVSAQAISTLERGSRKHPRRETIGLLAKALNLPDAASTVLYDAAGRPSRSRSPSNGTRSATAHASRSDVVPRCLPPAVADFTGRAAQVDELQRLLSSESAGAQQAVVISAIEGMGGIGKTTLAVRVAHALADAYPDGQLYINLRGFGPGDPMTPDEALTLLLGSLGVDQSATVAREQSVASYRSHLAGKRILVVLDNAADVEQVSPLLPGVAGCAAIITSRRSLAGLPGARHLALDVLSDSEAFELLSAIVGCDRVSAEPEAAHALVQSCGLLPLAIRIVGARLTARPAWPIAKLAAQLSDEHRRLDGFNRHEVGVRSSFAASLRDLAESDDSLDRAAAASFPWLGIVDGPDFGIEVAARVLDDSIQRVDEVLERLVDSYLVQSAAPDRYRLHDLLRSYAHETAEAQLSADVRSAALVRVLALFNSVAWRFLTDAIPTHVRLRYANQSWTEGVPDLVGTNDARRWLADERLVMISAMAHGADAERVPADLVSQLAIASLGFVSTHGYWQDLLQISEIALRTAARSGDVTAEAFARHDRGAAVSQLGRDSEAVDDLTRSVDLFRSAGDQVGEAMALCNLAYTFERLGRADEGIAAGLRGLRLSEIGEHRQLEATTRLALGLLYGHVGDRVAEVEYLERCLDIYADINHERGRARALYNVGAAYARTGRREEARRMLEASMRLCDALNIVDTAVLTRALLVDHYIEDDHRERALLVSDEALSIALSSHSDLSEADARLARGRALAALDRAEEAGHEWQLTLSIYRRLGAAPADEVERMLARLPDESPAGNAPLAVVTRTRRAR